MDTAFEQEFSLRISGELTIYRAAEIKQLLTDACSKHASIALDLSGVTEVDSAGLQVLVYAKKRLEAGSGVLTLTAQSNAVAEVLALLNLGEYFGDPIVASRRRDNFAERPSFNP